MRLFACLPHSRRLALWACAFILTVSAVVASDTAFELQPLRPRSKATDGAVGFTRLMPEATGVIHENRYDDPRMWAERFQEHAFGSIASGLAVGDFDGDGLPDLFVVHRVGQSRLYRNLGGMRFEDVTVRAGIAPDQEWSSGATFADIDGDGRLDLWVGRHGAPNRVYLNNGDGTFVEAAARLGLNQATSSVMAAFIDYDRDGDLDCYLVTNRLDARVRPGEPDVLLHNDGGVYVDVSRAANVGGGYQTFASAWADFDRDGWPDVYVANDFAGPDFLYRNQGDGTFQNVLEEQMPLTSYYSMGADVGDIDRDGWFDILVADMLPTDHRQFLKNTAELFAIQEGEDAATTPQTMRNVLFLNTGTGHFREIAWMAGLAATDWTWAALLADLDNDGWEDAFFTTGMFRDFMDADLIQRLGRMPDTPPSVMWKAAPELRQPNLVFRNRGDLRFENVSKDWGLDEVGVAFGAVTVDLDRDGDLDLVVNNYNGPPSVYRNYSTAGGSLLVELRSASRNRHGIGATIRIRSASGHQARFLSLARGVVSGHEPVLHFGLGADPVVDELVVEWPSGYIQTLRDLPANRMVRITEPAGASSVAVGPPELETPPFFREASAARGLNHLHRRAQTAAEEAARQPLVPWRFDGLGPGVAVADVDRNGRSDVYLPGAAGQPGVLWRQDADGRFVQDSSPVVDPRMHPMAPLWVDIDGDGHLDLFLADGGSGVGHEGTFRHAALRNDSQGRFTAMPSNPALESRSSAAVAVASDFDRSGLLEIFVGGRAVPGSYPVGPESRLLAWRDGALTDITDEAAPGLRNAGLVTAALWSDADGDGWSDLLLACEWGPLQLWHNRAAGPGGGRRLTKVQVGFEAQSGWWSSLVSGDFNGDGRIDYVAGNVGLNTRYTASTESPSLLLASDWTGGGRIVPIEARFDAGVLRPWRGSTELLRGLGARTFAARVLRRLPTFAAYGEAQLEDIFAPAALAEATMLAATEFRSGVYLNEGGRFRFVPLPIEAQLAPIFGAAATEVNGDGRTDLILVGNSHAPAPVAGRFSGGVGVVLLGNGQGEFVSATPRASGFVVPGSARGLALLDLDGSGRPAVVVARDVRTALLFEPAADTPVFMLALRGIPGNPAAVGSRVEVTHHDGSRQLAELAAGSGYLGQSAPLLFFGAPARNLPVWIDVSWPDGRRTRHPWSPGPRIELSPENP